MLFATSPDGQRGLPNLDKKYVDAVRSTLVRDYSAAAQDYEAILKALPPDQKAAGYVDLGRAYEKAGKIHETLASYEKAGQLMPDDPAPFVHIGILKSRQRENEAAEAAFDKAEALYQAESNLEGLAEVDYQRAYAANERAAAAQAREYLDKSLAIARQIPSVQLEIRSLSQLSSVEYNAGNDDKAIEYANQAILLAQDNGLEYWLTDGLMRLGNVYMDKGDFAKAEASSQQALHMAQQNEHPRLEADAQFTLASIRDQQGKWDESIAFARQALKYYRDFGFTDEAALASELLVRGEEGKGDFAQARHDGEDLLRLAEQTHSEFYIEGAEETMGNVTRDVEDYPEALAHFERAHSLSQSLHANEAYEGLHCAEVLWRLGRYNDAQRMLASIPLDAMKRRDIALGVEDTRLDMELSQGGFAQALAQSRNSLRAFPEMRAGMYADLFRVESLAESQLGQLDAAQRDAEQLLALARKEGDEAMIADAELTEAEVLLRSHEPFQAKLLSEQAYQYYAGKKKKESEWLSLSYGAKAAKLSGDARDCSEKAAQAIDILNDLEQSWGSPAFHQYITRPDLQIASRELSAMKDQRRI